MIIVVIIPIIRMVFKKRKKGFHRNILGTKKVQQILNESLYVIHTDCIWLTLVFVRYFIFILYGIGVILMVECAISAYF
jgi:hypothetical protein